MKLRNDDSMSPNNWVAKPNQKVAPSQYIKIANSRNNSRSESIYGTFISDDSWDEMDRCFKEEIKKITGDKN